MLDKEDVNTSLLRELAAIFNVPITIFFDNSVNNNQSNTCLLYTSPVLKKAFEDGLLSDHDSWRRMAKARNTTSHIYNEGEAGEIVVKIYDEYSNLLKQLDNRLSKEQQNMNNNLDSLCTV